MTFRKKLLEQIGKVPEALRIEADEYLFTLGGFFSDVLILRESLAFYRLHDKNAFQIADGDREATRRKQKILEALRESLKAKLAEHRAPEGVARMVIAWIETEAELIRLSLDAGLPWETLRAELHNYRVMHPSAPAARWIFKCLALLPACVMPSRNYYALRASFSQNGIYRKAREKWLPFLEPAHVDRYRTTRP
jgi:hypothetical protein